MSPRYDFSSQRSFSPYPERVLPRGFQYPESYLEHAHEMLYPRQFPWWFIDAGTEVGELSWKTRLDRKINWRSLETIDPIPFARNGELAAYFDGKVHSGDPPVYVVHLPDSICIGRYDSFAAWLSKARAEGGIGDPPYDKVTSSPSNPAAAEQADGYSFCPNCFEANQPLKEYDEAIRCTKCGTLFNCG